MERTEEHKRKFEAFKRANPEVWQLFVIVSKEVKLAGFDRYGARAIWEIVRFRRGGNASKLNNNFVKDYALELVSKHPEFKGFFEFRSTTK